MIEREVGGAVDSAGDSSGRMGRVGRFEAFSAEYAEEQRWVDGAVPAEEGRVADDAVEGDARGGGAGEVSRGGDAEEDLFQEVAGEGRQRPLRLRGFEAGDGPADPRRHSSRKGGKGV